DDLILFQRDVFQAALFGQRRRRQARRAYADNSHVVIGVAVRARLLQILYDVIHHRAAFVDAVLDERHARHVADQITARHVSHKLLVALRHFAFGNLLGRVDDNAGLRHGRAFHLATGVFHALFDGDGRGLAVDYGQHVVRAGVNTGVAADAGRGI